MIGLGNYQVEATVQEVFTKAGEVSKKTEEVTKVVATVNPEAAKVQNH